MKALILVLKRKWYDITGYWDNLKHQAAISAMQGILSNPELSGLYEEDCAAQCNRFATSLVEKLKQQFGNTHNN